MKDTFHRTALRVTLHGPFSLYRPGLLKRLRENGPLILAASLATGLVWFFVTLFSSQP